MLDNFELPNETIDKVYDDAVHPAASEAGKFAGRIPRLIDDEHEVGLLLTNFGQSILMQVCEISYEESVLLIFKGYVNGKYSTLIQHVSQLNFLITSVEKEPDKPKRKIGFIHPDPE